MEEEICDVAHQSIVASRAEVARLGYSMNLWDKILIRHTRGKANANSWSNAVSHRCLYRSAFGDCRLRKRHNRIGASKNPHKQSEVPVPFLLTVGSHAPSLYDKPGFL
jgi:hypothetical protein